MIKNGYGGANTNLHGLQFEKNTDLQEMFAKAGVEVPVGAFHGKRGFSSYLKTLGVDVDTIWSKNLRPDEALFLDGTVYIIEKKWQQVEGSVDEKLQTCDFKRRQYERAVAPLGMKVKFVYLLNDWFKNPKYRDVMNYITDTGCYYFFNEIPLEFFGLT